MKIYKSRYIVLDMDNNICVKQIKKHWWSPWTLLIHNYRDDELKDTVVTYIKDPVAKLIRFENIGFKYNKE